MTRSRYTRSHHYPPDGTGYPYDKIVVGIAEASAQYFKRNDDPHAIVSRISHVYHFLDGVTQTLHMSTFRTQQHTPGQLPFDTVDVVDLWDRPFVPDRGAFATSLAHCQRRYTHLDQIYAINRYCRAERTAGKKRAYQPIQRTVTEETLDPQHTIDLSRRHTHTNYRHPGDP